MNVTINFKQLEDKFVSLSSLIRVMQSESKLINIKT